MATGSHFECPKITFDHISGHFRSIWFFFKFCTKWPPTPILDVRNSLLIAFLAISDRLAILDVRNSRLIAILAISDRYRIYFFGGHFGCPKITFDRISGHFRSIGHFGCPKFTFDGISGHFRSIRNFFKKFDKMATGGHFGCSKLTFDRISGHFRSMRNFFYIFFYKMAAGGHFGWDDNVNYRTRYTGI